MRKITEKAILNDPFPFRTAASLQQLIAFWKSLAESESEFTSAMARDLLERLEDAPELMAPEVSLEQLSARQDLLEPLMTAVFPAARLNTVIAAAFVPFYLRAFYSTKPFDELQIIERFLLHNEVHGFKIDLEQMLRGKTLNAYYIIASHIYGLEISHDFPFVISLPEPETGLNKYLRVIIDPTFCTVRTPGPVPELSESDRRRLRAQPGNLELWMELLPPENFEFFGFAVMTAVDVTQPEVLSKLKNDLLMKEAMTGDENLDRLERHLRELLGQRDLRLGLIALDRCRTGHVGGARPIGRSLLLEGGMPDHERWEKSYYARVIENGRPVFVDDLTDSDTDTGFEHKLKEQGYRNVFLAPLKTRGEVLGILELASPNCCDITAVQAGELHEVTTLFSTAISRSLEEQEDRVQAIIKKQYTAIHPVVEWRFRETALKQLELRQQGEAPVVESIVFDHVYPLYGMSDIRGSSELRMSAIQEDLTEQIGLALAVIIEASAVKPRPSLDEMGYRLSRHIEDLVAGTRQGDERALIMLLQTEVEPLFDRLSSYSPRVEERVRAYRDALDDKLGVVYRKRKAYENSVSDVNDAISTYLDSQEEQAQSMIEHYFEKYKTDGVEYNLYAGASLLEHGKFDELDLKNLKLWQLTAMAGVVWEMDRVKSRLSIPLETAHLILVQSTPLSIRFRIDEKKFDVDGAYNIRYEIVKKRIDKAVISGTSERLTQPGMIAIVYSQEAEGDEYLQYLDYLQAAGYLEPGIEKLELERLQGVQGLKALRVRVADRKPASDLILETSGNNSRSSEARENVTQEQSA